MWLHVVTSVGWMSQALALFVLMTVALFTEDPAMRVGATSMARVLDTSLLAPLANASAFTGFMLAAATPWGFFRHWWVLAKFAITLVQLYAGIFVLSGVLEHSAEAARAGVATPVSPLQLVGTASMAGAIAFQAWLSVAKPWSRTPWSTGAGGRAPKLPTAPTPVFVATVAAPLVDIAVGTAMGHPFPVTSLLVLFVWLALRRRWERRERPGRRQHTVPVAASP